MTTPDTQKWRERAREIVSIIAGKEAEIRKMGFASMFLKAIENSIASVAAEAAHEASQSVVKAVEDDWVSCGSANRPDIRFECVKIARLASSNYPAPGEK